MQLLHHPYIMVSPFMVPNGAKFIVQLNNEFYKECMEVFGGCGFTEGENYTRSVLLPSLVPEDEDGLLQFAFYDINDLNHLMLVCDIIDLSQITMKTIFTPTLYYKIL